MIQKLDPDEFGRRVVRHFKSGEDLKLQIDSYDAERMEFWNQDRAVVGRVLCAHIYVECYLDRHLENCQPPVNIKQLKFADKILRMDKKSVSVQWILPGLKQLNKLRNDVAHNLHVTVGEHDAKVFLATPGFEVLREMYTPGIPSQDLLVILEEFSRHAAIVLSANRDPVAAAMTRTFEELTVCRHKPLA